MLRITTKQVHGELLCAPHCRHLSGHRGAPCNLGRHVRAGGPWSAQTGANTVLKQTDPSHTVSEGPCPSRTANQTQEQRLVSRQISRLSSTFWRLLAGNSCFSTQRHHQVSRSPSPYVSFSKVNLFLFPPVLSKGGTKETFVVPLSKCKIELIRKIYASGKAASCWPSLHFLFSNGEACLREVHW